MTAGGGIGWCVGFAVMLVKGSMDIGDITAVLWPIGGAFAGVIGGALAAQAL